MGTGPSRSVLVLPLPFPRAARQVAYGGVMAGEAWHGVARAGKV